MRVLIHDCVLSRTGCKHHARVITTVAYEEAGRLGDSLW